MNYSVYTGSSKAPNNPITLTMVKDKLSRHEANDMARSMRVRRENNNTLIGVWNGQKFKSLF